MSHGCHFLKKIQQKSLGKKGFLSFPNQRFPPPLNISGMMLSHDNACYWVSGRISICHFSYLHTEKWEPRELCVSSVSRGVGNACVYSQLFILPLRSYLKASQSSESSVQPCEIKDYCPLSEVGQLEPKFAKTFSVLYAVRDRQGEIGRKEERLPILSAVAAQLQS